MKEKRTLDIISMTIWGLVTILSIINREPVKWYIYAITSFGLFLSSLNRFLEET